MQFSQNFHAFSCPFHLIGGQVGHPRLLHLWAGARGLPCAKGGRARWGAEGGGWCPWAWVMYSKCWNLEAMQLMQLMQLQSYSFIFGGFYNPDGHRTCMLSIRSSKHVVIGRNSAGGTGLQNCDWAAERRSYWNRRTNGRPGARCIRLCDALYGDQVGGILCMIGQDSRECNLFQTSRYRKTSTRAATHFFRYFSSYVCTFGLKQEAVWAKHRGFPGHAAACRLESVLKPKSGFRDPMILRFQFPCFVEIPISMLHWGFNMHVLGWRSKLHVYWFWMLHGSRKVANLSSWKLPWPSSRLPKWHKMCRLNVSIGWEVSGSPESFLVRMSDVNKCDRMSRKNDLSLSLFFWSYIVLFFKNSFRLSM